VYSISNTRPGSGCDASWKASDGGNWSPGWSLWHFQATLLWGVARAKSRRFYRCRGDVKIARTAQLARCGQPWRAIVAIYPTDHPTTALPPLSCVSCVHSHKNRYWRRPSVAVVREALCAIMPVVLWWCPCVSIYRRDPSPSFLFLRNSTETMDARAALSWRRRNSSRAKDRTPRPNASRQAKTTRPAATHAARRAEDTTGPGVDNRGAQ